MILISIWDQCIFDLSTFFLTLHMAVGALESVTTTSGHLICDKRELEE